MGVTEEKVKISLVDAFSKGLIDLHDQLNKNEKRLEGVAGAAKVAASGMLALGGASIVKILKDSAGTWAAAVNDIMDKTNMEGEAASRLLAVSSAVGLSNEDMGNAIMKMSKNAATAREQMLQYSAAGQESTDIFTKWGITITDDNNNLLSSEEILRNVTARHREMANGTAKNALEMEIFGKSGGKMNDMLNLTDERMNEFINNAKRAGLIISSDLSQKWEDFDQNNRMLEASFQGLKVQIGNELLPQFISLSDTARDTIASYGELDDETKKFIATCVEASAGLAAVGFAANTIIWLSKPFVAAVGAMELSLGSLALAAGPVVIALAAIKKGYDDMKHAEAGGEFTYNELGQSIQIEKAKTEGMGGFRMLSERASNEDIAKLRAERDKENASAYNGGSHYSASTSAADAAAKKAETEYERMVGRYQKLVSEMDMKITEEVGTDADKVTKKAEQEIASMQEDINRIRAQGIDTTKLDELMKKYKEEIVPLKIAEADRNEKIQKYKDLLESSSLQIDIENKTNDEINAIRAQQLNDYEAFLREQLKSTKLKADERLKIEQDLADAIKQKNDILAQDINKGWELAVSDLKNYSVDYRDIFSGMFNDISSDFSSMFDDVIDNNESAGNAIMGVWEDVFDTLLKTAAKAAMQMLVIKPMFSWLSDILGTGTSGSGSGSSYGLTNMIGATDYSQFDIGGFASGGLASGWSIVGEHGAELVNFSNPARVYTANQTQAMLSQNTPALQVNITNNSGTQVKEDQTSAKFDGEKWVIDVVLDAAARNVNGFGRNMKTALSGI